jgi:hypothetical protein
MYKFSKIVGAMSNFMVPEGWHAASSMLSNHSFGVTCKPCCYFAVCAEWPCSFNLCTIRYCYKEEHSPELHQHETLRRLWQNKLYWYANIEPCHWTWSSASYVNLASSKCTPLRFLFSFQVFQVVATFREVPVLFCTNHIPPQSIYPIRVM